MRAFWTSFVFLLTPIMALGEEPSLKIATSFTILQDMAAHVAGDKAEIVSITKPGADIHNYQPTPQDLVRIRDVDLILWNGLNLELWFEQFLAQSGDIPSVILTEGIEPISITEGEYQDKPNPHAWMGLDNALIYVENIKKALIEIDPENAATYEANAQNYSKTLTDEITSFKNILADLPESARWVTTCEGAFSYLAQDLGLKELYLWPINADQIGTPQQVRHVIDEVRQNNIKVIFCESTVSDAPAKQVAKETGIQYAGKLYVDSLSEPDGPVPTYLDLIRTTTSMIAQGLKAAHEQSQ